ncbi:MAG: MFS transporter [Abditibacteriales bacterium]|nr:MFS transporter [Abditibacteriales bacterium]
MKKSPLGIIFLTIFLDLLGFGIVLPQLPVYAEKFGASGRVVGLLGASYSLTQFLFAPLWGRLSDRVGRRPVLMFSTLGLGLSYILFGVAHNLPLLFISRLWAGMAAANIATAQAYIADVTDEKHRAQGMALVGIGFGLGFILGPAVGGWLGHYGGNAAIGFTAAGLSLLNFLWIALCLPESLAVRQESAERFRFFDVRTVVATLKMPGVGLVIILGFFAVLAFANVEWTCGLFLMEQLGYNHQTVQKPLGYLFTYMGVIAVLVQGTMRFWGKRTTEQMLVVEGTLCIAVGLWLVPAAHNLMSLLPMLALLAVGRGLNDPSLSSLVSKLSPTETRGAVLGVYQSMSSLARIVGPAWGGFFFDRGVHLPFHTASMLMAVAFLLSLKLLTVK